MVETHHMYTGMHALIMFDVITTVGTIIVRMFIPVSNGGQGVNIIQRGPKRSQHLEGSRPNEYHRWRGLRFFIRSGAEKFEQGFKVSPSPVHALLLFSSYIFSSPCPSPFSTNQMKNTQKTTTCSTTRLMMPSAPQILINIPGRQRPSTKFRARLKNKCLGGNEGVIKGNRNTF